VETSEVLKIAYREQTVERPLVFESFSNSNCDAPSAEGV
jgi:hypothetical protein